MASDNNSLRPPRQDEARRPGFARRVREARARKGISQAQVGAAVGVSRVSVTQWESDRTIPDRDKLDRLAQALGVTSHWLEYGVGGADVANFLRCPIVALDKIRPSRTRNIGESLMDGSLGELVCPVACSPDTFVVQIVGVAMEPDFVAGMYAFVDPAAALKPGPGGRLFVLTFVGEDEHATIRELVTEGAQRYLRATNPRMPDDLVPVTHEGQVVGPVIFRGAPV